MCLFLRNDCTLVTSFHWFVFNQIHSLNHFCLCDLSLSGLTFQQTCNLLITSPVTCSFMQASKTPAHRSQSCDLTALMYGLTGHKFELLMHFDDRWLPTYKPCAVPTLVKEKHRSGCVWVSLGSLASCPRLYSHWLWPCLLVCLMRCCSRSRFLITRGNWWMAKRSHAAVQGMRSGQQLLWL